MKFGVTEIPKNGQNSEILLLNTKNIEILFAELGGSVCACVVDNTIRLLYHKVTYGIVNYTWHTMDTTYSWECKQTSSIEFEHLDPVWKHAVVRCTFDGTIG